MNNLLNDSWKKAKSFLEKARNYPNLSKLADSMLALHLYANTNKEKQTALDLMVSSLKNSLYLYANPGFITSIGMIKTYSKNFTLGSNLVFKLCDINKPEIYSQCQGYIDELTTDLQETDIKLGGNNFYQLHMEFAVVDCIDYEHPAKNIIVKYPSNQPVPTFMLGDRNDISLAENDFLAWIEKHNIEKYQWEKRGSSYVVYLYPQSVLISLHVHLQSQLPFYEAFKNNHAENIKFRRAAKKVGINDEIQHICMSQYFAKFSILNEKHGHLNRTLVAPPIKLQLKIYQSLVGKLVIDYRKNNVPENYVINLTEEKAQNFIQTETLVREFENLLEYDLGDEHPGYLYWFKVKAKKEPHPTSTYNKNTVWALKPSKTHTEILAYSG